MKRSAKTTPNDLAKAAQGYVGVRQAQPPFTAADHVAPLQYLAERGYLPAKGAAPNHFRQARKRQAPCQPGS
jgi:hypothetical protein